MIHSLNDNTKVSYSPIPPISTRPVPKFPSSSPEWLGAVPYHSSSRHVTSTQPHLAAETTACRISRTTTQPHSKMLPEAALRLRPRLQSTLRGRKPAPKKTYPPLELELGLARRANTNTIPSSVVRQARAPATLVPRPRMRARTAGVERAPHAACRAWRGAGGR